MKKINQKKKQLEEEFNKIKVEAVEYDRRLKTLTQRMSDLKAQYAVLEELTKK